MTKSQVLSYLYPQLIESRSSKYNDQINVYKFLGKYFISVNNFTQSGGLVTKIWQKATDYLIQNQFSSKTPKNLLILGLGTGNSIQYILKKWPDINITCIEIDPVMIELAKKYNHLDRYKQLSIINQDAFSWINSQTTKYDIVYIDLFVGKNMPKQSESVSFLKSIRLHLKQNGVVVINRATQKQHKKVNQNFQQHLNQVFSRVYRIKTPVNLVLAASQ